MSELPITEYSTSPLWLNLQISASSLFTEIENQPPSPKPPSHSAEAGRSFGRLGSSMNPNKRSFGTSCDLELRKFGFKRSIWNFKDSQRPIFFFSKTAL